MNDAIARKMIGPVFKMGPFALVLAAIAIDSWLYHSRCEFSPAVNWSLVAFGGAMQIFAVALLLAPRVLSFAPTLTELRYLSPISLVLFICAGAVVRDSIQFSDAFGQSKGYVSQGQRCSAR